MNHIVRVVHDECIYNATSDYEEDDDDDGMQH